MFDGLLRTKLPEGARYLAFVDDIAIIARGVDTIQIEKILSSSIEERMSWLQRTGLQLAVDKTEAMEISNAHLHNDMNIQVQGVIAEASRDLKYLGIQLDNRLSFIAHAKKTAEKANKAVQKLSRFLPNVSAAKQEKKTLMSNIVYLLLIYGAPVWYGKMSKKGIDK